MRAIRVARTSFTDSDVTGLALARDVREPSGRIALSKGAILGASDAKRLWELPWDELHLIELGEGDVAESEAGPRLARAAAGEGVTTGAMQGGHWPLIAERRGMVAVRDEALHRLNRLEGVAVYTLYDGQVVDGGEPVGRAKVVPFVIGGDVVARAESIAREAGGVAAVRPFSATLVGAVLQESLGERTHPRFREAIREKVDWLGSTLLEPRFVAPDPSRIAAALVDVLAAGARVILVAGSRPMDPLDPAFEALAELGAQVERRGVPAHPGSLLWLARAGAEGEIPLVGMPSCGLFSRATVFDLVLPRILVGERVDAEWLASLGHGGFLTPDMAFRFPPYRPSHERGEVV